MRNDILLVELRVKSPHSSEQLLSDSSCIEHCFSSGESLRVDDEQSLFKVKVFCCHVEICRVHICEEPEFSSNRILMTSTVKSKSLVDKLRPEVASTNTNNHKVLKLLPSAPSILAISHLFRKGLDSIQLLPNLSDDVLTIDEERSVPTHSQSHMENSSILSSIDPLAVSHCLKSLCDMHLLGNLLQQLNHFVCYLSVSELENHSLSFDYVL